MQNFDVQHNVACKQHYWSLPMCLALLQRGDTLSFVLNALLGKAVNTLRNIFHPFLYNFVEHFKRFYNETNNITNALKTIINALQCIVNAFKMHYNAVFVKPGFPK